MKKTTLICDNSTLKVYNNAELFLAGFFNAGQYGGWLGGRRPQLG